MLAGSTCCHQRAPAEDGVEGEQMQTQIAQYLEQQIRAGATAGDVRSALTEALARVSGRGQLLWDREGTHTETPATGAVLVVDWAIADRSYGEWYPSVERARAALEQIATQHGRVVEGDTGRGLYVDLTAPGCHTSRAYVDVVQVAAPGEARA